MSSRAKMRNKLISKENQQPTTSTPVTKSISTIRKGRGAKVIGAHQITSPVLSSIENHITDVGGTSSSAYSVDDELNSSYSNSDIDYDDSRDENEQSQVVPHYSSTEGDEEESFEIIPTKRKRGGNEQYDDSSTIKECDTVDEAFKYIRDMRMWKHKYPSNSSEGRRHIWVCKFKVSCSAKISIWLPNNSLQCLVQSNGKEHDHCPKIERGIEHQTKIEIVNLIENERIKGSKKILKSLRNKQIQCPSSQQVTNFVSYNKLKSSPAIKTLYELEEAIHSLDCVPSADDDAFVVSSYFDHDTLHFGCFWSTPLLLSFTAKSPSIHADSTYKLNYLDFPVQIVGTTDRQNHFHPFGLCLVSNETSKSFQFTFEALLQADSSYRPTILIADCAPAISRRFEGAFKYNSEDEYSRGYCWYHVSAKIDSKLDKAQVDDKTRHLIRKDINKIQVAKSRAEFDCCSSCFFLKWKKTSGLDQFLEYFRREYIDHRSNWFEGAIPGFPSTDNALEGTNSVLKKEYTLREKLPLQDFIRMALAVVRDWSQERNPEFGFYKEFFTTPNHSTAIQSDGYRIATDKSIQIKRRKLSDNNLLFFVPSETNPKPITEEEIATFLRKSSFPPNAFRSFDNYVRFTERMNVVKYDLTDWQKSTCDCAHFLKKVTCKHVIAIAVREKHFKVKPEAKAPNFLAGKRRPGRRPKVAGALCK